MSDGKNKCEITCRTKNRISKDQRSAYTGAISYSDGSETGRGAGSDPGGEPIEGIDVLAERVRRIGGTTIRSIGHISRLQTISDDDDEFVPAGEMVQRLLIDNRAMAENQRAAIEICDHNRDSATSNLLQELPDETERRIWFLYEVTQGAPLD